MNSSLLDRLDATHAFLWRWRWPIRLLVAVLLFACFGRWAYTRMTTPPAHTKAFTAAMYQSSGAPKLAADDPTKPLFDAIARVTALPTITAPATAPTGQQWRLEESGQRSPGMMPSAPAPTAALGGSGRTWSLDPTDAACGPWTPDKRYYLQQIIAYFEDPKVTAALEDVRQAARQPVQLPKDAWASGVFPPIRAVSKTLCAHARYEMAGKHDLEAACRDIEAVLDLADRTEDGGMLINYMVSTACRSLALEEIICWAREFDLTAPQAKRLQATIDRAHAELSGRWANMVQAELGWHEQILDGMFTRDTNGDGWVVLHTPSPDHTNCPLLAMNLLSPLVNDRRTIFSKLACVRKAVSQAGDLPYRDAELVLGKVPGARSQAYASRVYGGHPADGPSFLLASTGASLHSSYRQLVRCLSFKRTAQACVAAAAYKTVHGSYPARLDDLVLDFLPEVPRDPIDGQPMRYRVDERDGCVVYSVGEDGIDNGGGPLRDGTGELMDAFRWDWIILGYRDEPNLEWYLEPAPPGAATQQATSQQGVNGAN